MADEDTDATRPMDPDATRPHDGGGDQTLDATPATVGGAPPRSAPEPGDLPEIPDLAIEAELGRGGMGVVYRGRQTYIDRPVAVKVLLVRGTPSEEDFVRRFQREARLLAKFDHPHIVKCYQAGLTAAGSPYLVMEYVDGCTLRQQIERAGPLDQRQALLIARDLARALGHAQEAGIIHRDVKPENVLLQRGADHDDLPFVVKLADLGLARPGQRTTGDTSALTAQGMVLGTPATMAPEQFDDPDEVDFRCDIYGLGCVLHHALSGSPAFAGKSLSQLLKSKIMQGIPDTARASGCCKGVAEVVAWCLQPERERRPSSYGELIARMDRVLVDLGSGAGRAAVVAPPEQRSSPLGRIALVVLAVFVAGMVALLVLGVDHALEPDPAQPSAIGTETPVVQGPGEPDVETPPEPDTEPPPSTPAEEPSTEAPVPDPRDLAFGAYAPLWQEDFTTRLADWQQRPSGSWGSHEEVAGAIFGAAFGPRRTAMLSRELPAPPWRLRVRLAPLVIADQPPMREAGLWLRDGERRAVGAVIQALSAETILAVLRERTEADESASSIGPVVTLPPPPEGHVLILTASGDRVVATADGQELGEFELADPRGVSLRVEGGGVEVYALEIARPVD